ncbi:OmpA family protein [Bacteroides sp. 214]|uniref:OmpA family protein n=1 Tax=Bacteroides sp. 214 TaxID=2302935 RepID=UPI0013D765B1|nr:OmpA family protein [Bacteroides sp. 214]NDW13704.1 OmpA family protein [Bacteroides sp. 214]
MNAILLKSKKSLLLLLICLSASAYSQTAENEVFEETPFNRNWYIEVGGGAQVLFSKNAQKLDFQDRITPSISLTAGKWFSPHWGLRLQFQGYSLNGFSTSAGLYLDNPLSNGFIFGTKDPVRDHVTIRPDGTYRHYLRYANVHLDFQFSLLNLIGRVNEERKWDIIPAIGLGYMHLFGYKGTPDNDVMTANFSLMGKYKLNKRFDINIEAQTAVMPDQFDGRIAGRLYENNCALTLGVTYHLGKRGFNHRKTIYVPKEVIRIQRDTVTVVKEVVVEKKVFNEPFLLTSIRFNINKSAPISGQEMVFVNIAKYLDANPHASIRLDGYADKSGPSEFNDRLSYQRAETVKDILIHKYGVKAERLTTQGKGTAEQPYEKGAWNRVVLVTALEK